MARPAIVTPSSAVIAGPKSASVAPPSSPPCSHFSPSVAFARMPWSSMMGTRFMRPPGNRRASYLDREVAEALQNREPATEHLALGARYRRRAEAFGDLGWEGAADGAF